MNRRHLLLGLATAPAWTVIACSRRGSSAAAGLAEPSDSPRLPPPGEPLHLAGTLVDDDGVTPLPGFAVDAYHTDASGYYARPVNDPRRAHHWLRVTTDDDGRFELATIVPGRYANDPAAIVHVHLFLDGPEVPAHWVDDVHFAGDPAIDAVRRRGGRLYGRAIAVRRDGGGTWRGELALRLDRRRADRDRLVDGWYPSRD